MAATALPETLRFDAIEGWPAPEERSDWFGDPRAEGQLLDAYRGGRLHHAWLIGGPKGVGKATLAYRFARFLLAHPDPRAPEVAAATDLSVAPAAPAFRKVAARAHPNLLILERPYDDQAKRFRTELTVPEIRRTVSFFGSTGGEPGWRIAIVDPADDMNASSANALLKVLEEPPARSLFLIASHAPGRILPTIRSRCRRMDLPPLSREAMVAALTENAGDREIDPSDMALAAALADGSLRHAILLLEEEGIDTYRDLVRLLAGLPDIDIAAAHALADRVSGRGDDNAYYGFLDMLRAWLDRRVRRENEPETGILLAPAAVAAPLECWAQVWEKIDRSSMATDDLNLDRKRTILSILMTLARATRM